MLAYVTNLTGFVVSMTMVRRHVRFPLSVLIRRLGKSALVTLLAATVPLAALIWAGWRADVPVPVFLVTAAAYAAMWLMALFATRHPLRAEVHRLLRIDPRRVLGPRALNRKRL